MEPPIVVPVPVRHHIDVALVRRLVAAQFPRWADLPVRPVSTNGWDNQTFHLGTDMLVRLPSASAYALAVAKEHRWLPVLAPQLPLPIPVPLAMGEPAEGYPDPWSVYRWIDGVPFRVGEVEDLTGFARSVAEFLVALQRIDATGGPGPGQHNWFRGGSLMTYDSQTREAIERLGDRIPAGLATEIWTAALDAVWDGPPVWFHGDIAAGNLLVDRGRLSAVIDFGTSGVGDPACDMVIAWNSLSGASRTAFRAGLAVDPGTWARGRGWALWKALITYEDSRHVLDEIFEEYR